MLVGKHLQGGGRPVELKILGYLRVIAAEETKESMIHSRDGQRCGTVFDFHLLCHELAQVVRP
jgi:hypothetical protein